MAQRPTGPARQPMHAAPPAPVSCCFTCPVKGTYHDGTAEGYRSLILLKCKLGLEVSADRAVLAQLLLQPFRIPLEVFQQLVIRGYEQGSNVH